MKYLFFDIECSNCFNGIGKMCEFGYVLTDDKFNIKSKYEFVMSPGRGRINRFCLEGRKHQKDIVLSYEYEYYNDQPEFPAFYENIKKLIEDSDTICFAWSSHNDILHLFHACERYHKEPFKYICYDVQKIAGAYLETKKQTGLKDACVQIVGKESTIKLQEHLSSDDAKMTMMILEAICVLDKTDSQTLLNKSKYAVNDACDFVLNFKRQANVKTITKERHDLYKKTVEKDLKSLEKGNYFGKRYNFSGDLKIKCDDLEKLIQRVHDLGGILVNSLLETDYFVTFDDDNKNDISMKLNGKYSGKYITLDELVGETVA